MHKQLSSEQKYNIIGLMSGTSLDGLDFVCAEFKQDNNKNWTFKIHDSFTIDYNEEWKNKLINAVFTSGVKLAQLDIEIAKFYAETVNDYLRKTAIKVDYIASHGQTIFHQPNVGLTTQIGCGQTLASLTNLTVINDFRTKDVSLNGQGAPLVPIGDKCLFNKSYDGFLNLGGFANITIIKEEDISAFDISPANILLNHILQPLKIAYDNDGELGRTCKPSQIHLKALNELPFYGKKTPKSLGVEWLKENVFPIINKIDHPEDQLGTAYQHIANQISSTINHHELEKVLITGGGAKNSFLIELIQQQTKATLVLPSQQIIDFKEALIFGFLGILRLRNEVNCLSDVTGAIRDSSGGVIHNP